MIFKRRRRKLRCLRCGMEEFEWPTYCSDEFYEAHKCPSGTGHFYWAAADRPPADVILKVVSYEAASLNRQQIPEA